MVPAEKRSRSMELDEMIPVDQFFEDYVSRLQSSAFQEEMNPYAVGGVHRRPSTIPHEVISSPEGKLSAPEGMYGGVSGPPMTYDRFMTAPQHQSFGDPVGGGTPAQTNAMYMDSAESRPLTQTSNIYMDPSGNCPPVQTNQMFMGSDFYGGRLSEAFPLPYASAERMGSFGNVPVGQSSEAAAFQARSPMEPSAMYAISTEMTDTSNGGHHYNRKHRQKSARQQQLNKLAQQRYRERKKAKTLGLQQTVDILQEQLEQLRGVEDEKKALEERNMILEKKLVEKEAELQAVQRMLEESGGGSGNITAELPGVLREDKSVKLVGLDSRPAKLFHKKVKDLQKYLKNNDLDPALLLNPLDDSIPKKAVDDIYQLVGDVCMTCMQLTRYDGPDLWDLITASLDSKQRESHDRVMWRSIATSLKLGEDQISSALSLREQHLAKLEKIFVERQTLNLQAIQHLLPADQGGQAPVSSPLGCLNIATFVQRLRHTSKLNTVLDRLKENLSKEQKLNSELEYMTFYRVMSPLQGAWFTVSAYPHQCDCLEFLNAVSDLYSHKPTKKEPVVDSSMEQ